MFEYGGGATRKGGQGGWSELLFKDTLQSLHCLSALGYTQAVRIDASRNATELVFSLKEAPLDIDGICPPESIYGNSIALQVNMS